MDMAYSGYGGDMYGNTGGYAYSGYDSSMPTTGGYGYSNYGTSSGYGYDSYGTSGNMYSYDM